MRIAEPVQHVPDMLRMLLDAGVIPGARLAVERTDTYLRVTCETTGGSCDLALDMGSYLFLNPDIS
jgi:alpha-D-ribose 1-methylphosphonate 5-triphosphate synthase subunit PhnH